MINYIINNKNKPNFNKPRYDVLLNKTFYKKKYMNKINENYLKLVEDTILSNIHKYNYSPLTYTSNNLIKNLIKFLLNTLFNNNLKEITIKSKIKDKDIEDGLIRGTNSFSMIGLKRLKNIRYLIEKINEEKISGDLIKLVFGKEG